MTSTDSRTPTRRFFLLTTEGWIRLAVTLGVFGVAFLFLFGFTDYDYQWDRMVEGTRVSQWAFALWTTLWISLVALALSIVLGIAGGLMRMSTNPAWHQLGTIYVEAIRCTPLYGQVLFAYFVVFAILGDMGGAVGGETLKAWIEHKYVVGVLVLAVFSGAYVAEIVRAAVESVDKGQTEAALSQGMSKRQVYRLVVFPQALRRMLPPLAGQFVNLVKDSSLLLLIPGIVELMRQSVLVRVESYRDYETMLIMMVLYFVLCFALSQLARRLELRMAD